MDIAPRRERAEMLSHTMVAQLPDVSHKGRDVIFNQATWERVLLICPHPDDETLGAGILLQEAVSHSARIRVVYLTDGDRNPIAQLLHEGQLPLTARDRARFAAVRRQEAVRALDLIGVHERDIEFWHLPDQRLKRACLPDTAAASRMTRLVREFQPSLVVAPTPRDLHIDHVAAARMTRRAMETAGSSAALLTYRVHGDLEHDAESIVRSCSILQYETKLAMMKCHRTQLLASPARMLQLAERDEMFREWSAEAARPPVRLRSAQRLLHLLPAFRPFTPAADEPEALVRS